jgi:hypothetical protein
MPTDSRADQLLELLCELELDVAVLRRDPAGSGWLPEQARAWIESDAALREVVLEFSETECILYEEAQASPDGFFAARVMSQLPEEIPVRTDLRRRILGMSYVFAAGVAGAALTPSSWFEAEGWLSAPWHEWLDAVSMGGAAFISALAVSAVAVFGAGDGGEPIRA